MSAPRGALAPASRSFAADRRAWIVALALLTASVAFVSFWTHRRVVPEAGGVAPAAVSDWRLATLAFSRVDGAGLRDQLEALRRAGFGIVSVEQVRAALAEGAGLPPRALLLTFDDTRVETFDSADPLLRRLGWTAVMIVDPRTQRARDTRHVSWHRLELMVASGVWRLGARGDGSAASEIEASVDGSRVVACTRTDCANSDAIPLVDDPFGVTGAREPAGRSRVWRLAVSPEWTGSELVARLESAMTPPAFDMPSPAAVQAGAGALDRGGGEWALADPSRADLRLPGLRFAEDWTLEARVRLDEGQLWVVQEGEPGRTLWRAGLDAEAVYVQEADGSGALRQRARLVRKRSSGPWGALRVVKRGRGLLVFWNDAPVSERAVTFAARGAGRVAVVAASAGDGARAAAAGIVVTPRSPRIAKASPNPAESEVRRLAADAAATSGISPRWIEVGSDGVRESPLNRDLYAMLTHRHAWDLLPGVVVRDPGVAVRPGVAEEVARRAADAGFDGVRLEFAGASDSGARGAFERAFLAREIRVVPGS